MDSIQDLAARRDDLLARLQTGWLLVGPGGAKADDDRHVARFLELLAAALR